MSVENVLDNLGISVVKQSGAEMLALCPGHKERTGKEDHNPSWWINSDTGMHNCFSCGFKGTLPYLVAFVRGDKTKWGRLDFDAARRWVEAHGGVGAPVTIDMVTEDRYLRPISRKGLPEYQLALFDQPPTWALEARHLTEDAVSFYGILWDKESDCWITPIRDAWNSSLLGWQVKSQKERYFRNRPQGVLKSTTMFGMDRYSGGTMVVVESPLDAARLFSLGWMGVASFGAELSNEQLLMLRRAERLVVAMDNPRIDAAGKKAVQAVLDATKKYRFDCKFFNYHGIDAKDVGDMTPEEIEHGIKTAKHSVYGKQVLL